MTCLPLVGTGIVLVTSLTAFLLFGRRSIKRQIRNNGTFIITGAGSGLGRSTSRILYREYGAKLILVDRNEKAIDSLSKELGAESAIPFCCDLTDSVKLDEFCSWVQKNHGDVSGLLHFAGLTHGKRFLEASISEINMVLSVNLIAVIKLTRLVLPTILNNAHPIVLVVSSVAGLIGVDGMVDYCATKYGVSGFCESLRKELRGVCPDLCICCVYPYFINTGMFAGIKGSIVPELDQEYVSMRIVQAICNREEDVVIPAYFRILTTLSIILPRRITQFVGKIMGAENMMHGYTGRRGQ